MRTNGEMGFFVVSKNMKPHNMLTVHDPRHPKSILSTIYNILAVTIYVRVETGAKNKWD